MATQTYEQALKQFDEVINEFDEETWEMRYQICSRMNETKPEFKEQVVQMAQQRWIPVENQLIYLEMDLQHDLKAQE